MKNTNNIGLVRINKQGPPTVLEYTTDIVGIPKSNEVVISQKAIGLNFVDVLLEMAAFLSIIYRPLLALKVPALLKPLETKYKIG